VVEVGWVVVVVVEEAAGGVRWGGRQLTLLLTKERLGTDVLWSLET
jgi:hypothetical protein